MLTRRSSEALHGHVFEVTGLPTPDYKRLLDHSRALLAPSFAEGFGFPVAEALASGVPVIASDIAPFREQGDEGAVYLDPLSIGSWRRAVADLAFAEAKTPAERRVSSAGGLETLA
jgi:glycosyltransferase involved in cell wall biosynthesis